TSPTSSCRACTPARSASCCRASTRASGFPAGRRWPADPRSSRRARERAPRRAATRRCWWTRTTRPRSPTPSNARSATSASWLQASRALRSSAGTAPPARSTRCCAKGSGLSLPHVAMKDLTPLGDGESSHAVVLDLRDVAVVAQQVDVAQDLGEGEVRLRDRDIPPHRLGELVRGPRALGDQAEKLARAALVQPEALLDQRAVAADLLAVAGQHARQVHRPRLRERLQVDDERLGARAGAAVQRA